MSFYVGGKIYLLLHGTAREAVGKQKRRLLNLYFHPGVLLPSIFTQFIVLGLLRLVVSPYIPSQRIVMQIEIFYASFYAGTIFAAVFTHFR